MRVRNKKAKESRSAYSKTTKGILLARLDGMKARCNNKNRPAYKDYGGRGIKVCDEWMKNSESFYRWSLVNGFKKELEIDRIDNNGNYEANNCRWVTRKVNNRNKRISVTNTVKKTRICSKCKVEKCFNEFSRSKHEYLCLRYVCRNCEKIYKNKIRKK